MTFQQKVAWFNLSVSLLSIAAYFALLPVLGPWRATGAFGLLGLTGFSGAFYFIEKRKGRIFSDERDQMVSRNAFIVAKSAAWVVLFASFAAMMAYAGDNGVISVRALGFALWWLICGYLLTYSLATLILYARH